MAVSFVGSKTFAHNATSAQSCSLTDLLNSAGGTVAPAAGDVVFVNYVHSMATTANRTLAQCTPSGYSNTHGSVIQANDSNAVSMALSYKEMPGTPDTSVSIPAAAATTNSVSCTIECWRGVEVSSITTTTPTTASGTNTGLANPPSITTPASPAGCVVVGAFGAAVASAAAFTNSGATPYDSTTNVFKSGTSTAGTNDAVSGMGAKTGLGTSTAFDAAITGSTTTNTGSWGAASIVLRPVPTISGADANSSGTGAATGNSGTVIPGGGSGAGGAAVSGVAAAIFAGFAAALGVAASDGASSATVGSVAASSAAATADGTSGATAGSEGLATSAAAGTGSGAAVLPSAGDSGGVSSATATSGATASSVGSSQGSSIGFADAEDANGGSQIVEAEGSSAGSAASSASAAAVVAALAASVGSSVATGEGAAGVAIDVPLSRTTRAEPRFGATVAEGSPRTTTADDAGWTSYAPPRI